jgi:hypothetical protein
MRDPDLKPDCARCAALCCILLPFDAGPAFAFDKPAAQRCRNLAPDNRCTLHARLADNGFSGCVAFDCLGAGQRASALFIKGPGWLQDGQALARLDEGFRGLRQVHEAVALLKAAGSLTLPEPAEVQRQALLAGLDAGRDWTLNALAQANARGGLIEEIRLFLASLRDVAGLRPT